MDCCKFKEQMTRIIPSFAGFTAFTPTIPKMYWDVKSQEQRIFGLCKMMNKVICYADMLGENVDEIKKTLQDILDGKLDDMIVAAIAEWFDENEPEIVADIENLQRRVGTLEDDAVLMKADILANANAIELLDTRTDALESKFVGKYIGVLSTFRFGYRPPAGFNVNAMLAFAQDDYDIFKLYDWTYMPQSADMRQEIPLYTENPYHPGWQGEHVTCGGLVQDVLYRCGYDDLPRGALHYMRTGTDFTNYLESKGWIKEYDFNILADYPGSIIFQGARSEYETDPNTHETKLVNNPSHVFILKNYSYTDPYEYVDPITHQTVTVDNPYGIGECFDAGNDDYIQHGTPVMFNINSYQGRGYDILTQLQWSATDTGYYTFYAPWPYNNVYKYTYDPFENDKIKPDLYEYQGYTIQDENGRIFQHFECTEGVVSQWFSIYDVLHAKFRLRALSQAISADFYNTSGTITIPTDATTRDKGVFLTFNAKSETDDCILRDDNFSIEPQYRGLWIIDGLFNFDSTDSNTGIITAAIYEGEYPNPADPINNPWGGISLIGLGHCAADNRSPYMNISLLETIAPNDHPIFVVLWGFGLTNPVTVRNNRYNTCMRMSRLR